MSQSENRRGLRREENAANCPVQAIKFDGVVGQQPAIPQVTGSCPAFRRELLSYLGVVCLQLGLEVLGLVEHSQNVHSILNGCWDFLSYTSDASFIAVQIDDQDQVAIEECCHFWEMVLKQKVDSGCLAASNTQDLHLPDAPDGSVESVRDFAVCVVFR